MNTEEQATRILADLNRLSEFSMSLLQSENIRPETLYPRKRYVYSQFIFSISFLDGITTLAERGQARAMVPLVRSLWEGWVGVAFAYAGNSHLWVYYLQLQDELSNRKKRDQLYADGKVEDVRRYNERSIEAKKIINLINRRYKELPLVPGVITAKERSLTKRKISLKEKCQIIDYYQTKRVNYKPPATTLVSWYEWVYGHFSGTAHVSVTELNNLYKYDAAGGLHVDISGGNDRKYLASLLLTAYLHHYLLMKVFMENIAVGNHLIPDDIKAARRLMTGASFRKMQD